MIEDKQEALALVLQDLVFSWGADKPLLVIKQLVVKKGERLFLQGASGSGKSTLLGLLSGVLVPSSGNLSVLGQSLSRLSAGERDRFRADHIGIVFQMFNLLPYLSILANVTLPCRFSKSRMARAKENGGLEQEAKRLLITLGLGDEVLAKPVMELSVGQQQRVAAARALIGGPELVIADEPTSALDTDHREKFIKLLMSECAVHGTTLVFVSHDPSLGLSFDRSMNLSDINQSSGGGGV